MSDKTRKDSQCLWERCWDLHNDHVQYVMEGTDQETLLWMFNLNSSDEEIIELCEKIHKGDLEERAKEEAEAEAYPEASRAAEELERWFIVYPVLQNLYNKFVLIKAPLELLIESKIGNDFYSLDAFSNRLDGFIDGLVSAHAINADEYIGLMAAIHKIKYS